MRVFAVKETHPGESRVALVPNVVAAYKKAGLDVGIERGAGLAAGYPDAAYEAAGATVHDRSEAASAEILVAVRALGAQEGPALTFAGGQVVVAQTEPLWAPTAVADAAPSGASIFSLELVPRTTRAQAMDVLSSQANLAGYKAVLLGAEAMPKILPMMTTAAGTITPAKVLVLGAGVAGLQAIATAKRLGAVVSGYDVRPETKTQIESLGAKALDLGLEAEQGSGGYAAQQSAEFLARQQELLGDAMAEMDLIVTTAAVPGRRAPILIPKSMAAKFKPGTVIVDMAAERGGNCELTEPGRTVNVDGITVIGPVNLAGSVPYHASMVFAKNVANFVVNLIKDKALNLNLEDPIIAESLLTHGGAVVNARVKELLK